MIADYSFPYVHIFVAGNNLRSCTSKLLYGVRPFAINQAAMVRSGQSILLCNNFNGYIYGPYIATSKVLYYDEDKPIWKREEDGREAFRFIVGLRPSQTLYRCRMRQFIAMLKNMDIHISRWDLSQRSIFTFLPADGAKTLNQISNPLWEEVDTGNDKTNHFNISSYQPAFPQKWQKILQEEKLTEMLIEFALMNCDNIWRNVGTGIPIFNQMRVGYQASRCDLITQRDNTFYVIEVKLGCVGQKAMSETIRYSIWARGNRELLARNFAPTIGNPLVMGGILGSNCTLKHQPDAVIIEYALNDDRLELRRYN